MYLYNRYSREELKKHSSNRKAFRKGLEHKLSLRQQTDE